MEILKSCRFCADQIPGPVVTAVRGASGVRMALYLCLVPGIRALSDAANSDSPIAAVSRRARSGRPRC